LYSGDNALVSGRGAEAAVMVAALTLIAQRQCWGWSSFPEADGGAPGRDL